VNWVNSRSSKSEILRPSPSAEPFRRFLGPASGSRGSLFVWTKAVCRGFGTKLHTPAQPERYFRLLPLIAFVGTLIGMRVAAVAFMPGRSPQLAVWYGIEARSSRLKTARSDDIRAGVPTRSFFEFTHGMRRSREIANGTGGSRCLVGGAEGIRTAGPLCGSWRLRKARSFSGGHYAEPDQRIVLRATYRQIPAENGGTSASFPKGEKAKEDRRFESPPLQQRVSANRPTTTK